MDLDLLIKTANIKTLIDSACANLEQVPATASEQECLAYLKLAIAQIKLAQVKFETLSDTLNGMAETQLQREKSKCSEEKATRGWMFAVRTFDDHEGSTTD